VARARGVLVLDDRTLDQPYARRIGLPTRHWSGKHRRVVQGRNLPTLLWTDGEALIPCDYRLYEKATDGRSKNDRCRARLDTARARGFAPECAVFDDWYASLEHLKAIRGHGWRWLAQLKANRTVTPDGSGNRPLGEGVIAGAGTRVHRQGYGFVLVFPIGAPDGDREFWATSDEGLGELARRKYAEWAWGIAAYHRGLKQHRGVERAQVRAARARRNRSNYAIRAFLRLERHRLATGVRWWEAKATIIRAAIRRYLTHPRYTLATTTEPTA